MEQNGGRREIVDLRTMTARDLEPMLRDEIQEWRRELAWDFEPSAELVRRYAGTNSLGGAALLVNGEVAGYGYAVVEEPRGIIGDIFVRPHQRDAQAEAQLFRALSDALIITPGVTRMESQLMLLSPAAAEIIGGDTDPGNTVRLFGRCLMSRRHAQPLPPSRDGVRTRFRLESWDEHFMHQAGTIIAASYKGTADSEINSQYRSPAGARRFLTNIVEFPGCGNFHTPASFVAYDRETGEATGMVLSSFVADDTGHVSQLCVMPAARGAGLGRELLHEAVAALHAQGAGCVSLTVTASNNAAISLYEEFGFRNIRNFFAYIREA